MRGEGAWERATWRLDEHLLDAHVGVVATPLQLLAVGLTVPLALGPADAALQGWAAGHDEATSVAASVPGLLGGMVVPVALPTALLLGGEDEATRDAGAAALQAATLAFTLNTLLKILTNRGHPHSAAPASRDDSQVWRFGLLRQIPFDGWPSGHMMTNTAMSTALISLYPDSDAVAVGGAAWVAYMAGVTALGVQGGVHWASDVVAGGLMGAAIGRAVGLGFRSRRDAARAEPDDGAPRWAPRWALLPTSDGGLGLTGAW